MYRTPASLFLIVALAAGPLRAQDFLATLTGVLRDPSGAGIAHAIATLTLDATGAVRSIPADNEGLFLFPDLSPGAYCLQVEAKGFKLYRRRDVEVTPGQVRSLGEILLSVGGVTETVTVDDTAVRVDLSGGERSGIIPAGELESTPLRGRDYLDLLHLLPGIVDESEGRDAPGPDGPRNIYINGGRDNQKNITIDGVSSVDTGTNAAVHTAPTLHTIAEVRVLTSNYQAEFGRAVGGAIIVTTRGGSRRYTGTASWSHRHEEFNANNFFSNQKGMPRTPYRYNLAGWSAGGPLRRSRLFFFAAQEFIRQNQSYDVQSVRMPTVLERQGDFSQTLDLNRARISVYDPVTAQPFPNNMIPKARQSAAGQAILNMFPLPNFVDPVPSRAVQWNYLTALSGANPRRQDMVRIDYTPGPWQTYVRYTQDTDEQHPAYGNWIAGSVNYDLTPITMRQPGRAVSLNLQRPLARSWFHQLILGYSMNRLTSSPDRPDRVTRSALGIDLPQWWPQWNPAGYIPNMTFGIPGTSPNPSMNNAMPYRTVNHIFSASEGLSRVQGAHTIRLGVYAERARKDQLQATPTRGAINFADDSNNPLRTRYGFASALLGVMTSYQEATGKPYGLYRFTNLEWYAQDSWRATRRLSLDYGVRFYHDLPQYEARGQTAAFVPALYTYQDAPVLIAPGLDAKKARIGVDPLTGKAYNAGLIGAFAPGHGNTADGMAVSGASGFPPSLYRSPALMVGPRVGFAYDPIGRGRTVLRGGFGLYFDRVQGTPTMNMAANPPTAFTPTLYYTSFADLVANAGSALLAPSTIGHSLYGKGTMPQSYQYSFGVQHSIGRYTKVEAAYVGNVARHLLWQRNINPVPAGAQFLILHPENKDATTGSAYPVNFLRPYRGYGDIMEYEFAATSSYNALQSTLVTRLRGGFDLRTSYTWSKALGTANSDTAAVSPFFDPRSWNYGRLSYSRDHVLTMTPSWRMPRSILPRNRVLRAAMAEWAVYVTAQFSTGQPYRPAFSTTDGENFTGTPSQSANPLWISGTTFWRPAYPRAANTVEQPYWGNAGAGILTRPGINNFDGRLQRRFRLGSERRTLDLRVEAFNAFNHTQFSNIDTTARFDTSGAQINSLFLQPNAARRARMLNLGAQVNF
jgi:hypothetical protein